MLVLGSTTEHAGSDTVLALLVILAAAAAVTMLARRIRLATIPGYLITGAIIGPFALGLVSNPQSIQSISDLAILMLMFTVGLHLDLGAVRGGLVPVLGLGVVSTLASVLLGWPLGMAAGLSAPVALTVSMALSMSSTAVVLRLLQQHRETHSMHGRVCFGVLITQDLLALVILALLPPLAEWSGSGLRGIAGELHQDVALAGPHSLRLIQAGALALGGIALMIILGRVLLPRLLAEAAKDKSAETLLVLSAALALGAAVLTGALGFSPELGAFLAGFLLASTPFRHQLSGQLAPMRDLFMAVFFTAVGLELDLHAVVANWWLIALGLPALLIVKALAIGASTWAAGATAPTSALAGVSLAQAGEFSLVILAAAGPATEGGSGYGIIPAAASGPVMALVVLSLIITPGLFELGHRLRPRFASIPPARWLISPDLREHAEPGSQPAPENDPQPSSPRHVIIAGFGVVGRNIAEHFGARGIPFTVIELNPATVKRQQQLGRSIIFGDVANAEVLESAGIRRADAVILTIPDDDATLRACRVIRSLAPKVFIAARTSYLSRAIQATELGADQVTVEEVATARDMAAQVMAKLGGPRPAVAVNGQSGAAAPAAAGAEPPA
jgi:Kef-type K+ transport system membrane component KefB